MVEYYTATERPPLGPEPESGACVYRCDSAANGVWRHGFGHMRLATLPALRKSSQALAVATRNQNPGTVRLAKKLETHCKPERHAVTLCPNTYRTIARVRVMKIGYLLLSSSNPTPNDVRSLNPSTPALSPK